jgi:hypothetical protein
MNAVNMPGFTADKSLYKKGDFRVTAIIAHHNATEKVQLAMIDVCALLKRDFDASVAAKNWTGVLVFWAAMDGAGCFG